MNPMTGPFRLSLVANQADPRMATSCIRPKGILNNMVWNLSKPKSLIIREPKTLIPPLGILLQCQLRYNAVGSKCPYARAMCMATQHQVLRSRKHSATCSHFHSLEFGLLGSELSRSMTMDFSRSVRNDACVGESGR